MTPALRRTASWLGLSLAPKCVGMWVAVLVLPAFVIDGSVVARMVTLVLVTVGVAVALTAAIRLIERWYGALPQDERFWLGAYRLALYSTVHVASYVAVVPAALWLAVRAAAALGLPVRLPGWWPTVAAAVLACALGWLIARAIRVFTVRGRAEGAVWDLVQYLLCLVGFWLAVAVFGGALARGDTWRAALTLAGLAAVFNLTVGWLVISLAGLEAVLLLCFNAARLWAVAWLSGWMVLTLEISDAGWFLATLLVITVAMVPARLAQRSRMLRTQRRARLPEPPMAYP